MLIKEHVGKKVLQSSSVAMSKKDIGKVVSALETLEKLNRKYDKPYGDNPMGIAVYVYKLLKKGGDKHGLAKAGPTA